MKAVFSLAWVAGFTALAVFSIRDAVICKLFIVLLAVWGMGDALWQRTARGRRFFVTVSVLAGIYALIIFGTWWLAAVTPDWAYLRSVCPYLLAGMVVPAAFLGIGPIQPGKCRWFGFGIFLAAGLAIAANTLRWLDYQSLQTRFIHPSWDLWTEKYYIYWQLLLLWGCTAFFTWRRKADRPAILVMLVLTVILIWFSGRSARALGILGCGLAVYFLLSTLTVSLRWLKVGVALMVLWWGAAPWLLKVLDLSRIDRRVEERTLIYRASYDLVQQQPWVGHGFGNARHLTHSDLPELFGHHLPGGHPHNLGLLFWLEYGFAGAVFLCCATWYLLQRLIKCAHARPIWPALAALIVTFVAMVSFSWDIWDLQIILFYAMFAGLVLLIFNVEEFPRKTPLAGDDRSEAI
jgi:O-antigen ligase